ncbi:MAG TPA: hypothetical protein VFH47_07930, partial [Candidatus Thermoplasmatota archaeon]|nr:hypothetical protein [Candidatus Thermoplasmatota archaeon]
EREAARLRAEAEAEAQREARDRARLEAERARAEAERVRAEAERAEAERLRAAAEQQAAAREVQRQRELEAARRRARQVDEQSMRERLDSMGRPARSPPLAASAAGRAAGPEGGPGTAREEAAPRNGAHGTPRGVADVGGDEAAAGEAGRRVVQRRVLKVYRYDAAKIDALLRRAGQEPPRRRGGPPL